MSPTLPAYRDAGEMAASAYTLGVSHPPSYPLYILLGHMAQDVPLGSPAYRLTLLAALSSSLLLALMFWSLSRRFGSWPAIGSVLLMGFNTTFWSISVVPEMYSLMLLFAWILWMLASELGDRYHTRGWLAFVYLYSLFLGNRTELVLWAPGLLRLAFTADGRRSAEMGRLGRWLGAGLALVLLGASVYLYLPVRSLQGPWLDWNHPATLENFIGSLTRRGYGGTLDLLSKSYAFGDNFLANMAIYAGHLWNDYLGAALGLVALGLVQMIRKKPSEFGATALLYLLSGPAFLLLANMPPNPHALAIVEPHYLLSDLVLAIWAAQGLAELGRRVSRRWLALIVGFLGIAPWTLGQGLSHAGGNWRRVNRRWDLVNYDYCRNVLRSVPEGGILVSKKDVQLFSLWYFQTVERLRPDVLLVAQGLSGSSWYQASKRRLGSAEWVGPLRDAADWRQFIARNASREIFATTDVELPAELAATPRGLVLQLPSAAARGRFSARAVPGDIAEPGAARLGDPELPWLFFARRGDFRYEGQSNFFNSDLVEAYAISYQHLGNYYLQRGALEQSLGPLYRAWTIKWLMPEVPALLGFSLYRLDRKDAAAQTYDLAIDLFGELLGLARRYHALPSVTASLTRSQAEAHLNRGVLAEKTGDRAGAESHYREAIRLSPAYAQPHYNLAVLHWGKDWAVVIREMSETLRLDPSHAEAARFLAAARQRALLSK
ncbi:MAG: DUF2723 domain-containing protein [Elusimicrobia bacterium]|nr:DUF2723 domain-containing protein [Elusimicrobiota bacterium]